MRKMGERKGHLQAAGIYVIESPHNAFFFFFGTQMPIISP